MKRSAFLLFDTAKKWLIENGMQAKGRPDKLWRKTIISGALKVEGFTAVLIKVLRITITPGHQAFFEYYGI